MAGRHVDTHGNIHEAAGIVVGGGRFVTQPASEVPANLLRNRALLSAARTDMSILEAEGHLEEASASIRSSWATRHTGSKTDQVFWAKHSLEQATMAQAQAAERIAASGEDVTFDQQARFDRNEAELAKLNRWVASANNLAKDAVLAHQVVMAEFEARKAPVGPDGSIDQPVKHDDPRLIAGEVFDTVESADGQAFHRRREGVFPDAPYALRIQVDRPIDSGDLSKMARILGSAYATTGWNEGLGWPEQDTPFSFIVSADTTKGRAYRNLDKLEENLATYMVEGSPVAKTNRGRTPKGERYVEGFGESTPKFELYYEGAPIISAL
jgi:hypothetical protein